MEGLGAGEKFRPAHPTGGIGPAEFRRSSANPAAGGG